MKCFCAEKQIIILYSKEKTQSMGLKWQEDE